LAETVSAHGVGSSRRSTSPAWTQEAWARFAQLEGRLEYVVDKEDRRRVMEKLSRARQILENPVPPWGLTRLANWWNGDRIERTWVWLEETEIEIVASSNDEGLRAALNIALQRAEGALSPEDRRRIALGELAGRAAEHPHRPLESLIETDRPRNGEEA
jgi:hypothetical protein